jgi:cob(I)alamin adenosyltransferase
VKIYTRGGDRGETSLLGGGRVPKGHARVEAMGAVDELNAVLGWAVAQLPDGATRERLQRVQHDLFTLGAGLASRFGEGGQSRTETPTLVEGRTAELEAWIDELTEGLPELTVFVLPGGAPSAAALHVARTVCRRAERAVVRLTELEAVASAVVPYLNRLSDLLFTLARAENQRSGGGDIPWQKPLA